MHPIADPLPDEAGLAYTIPEAARASRVGIHFLREQVNAGRLKTRFIGKRRIVLRSDLEELLRSLPTEAA